MKIAIRPTNENVKWPKQPTRCGKTVTSTGTHYFDGNKHQCGRAARFNINSKLFCTQHAGEFALKFLIDEADKHDIRTFY